MVLDVGVGLGIGVANAAGSRPFTAFNFRVEITLEDGPAPLCDAAFSECDGLEMTMDVKTIREGGNNGMQIRLTGPTSYGTVTLKRGVTSAYDLWSWFDRVQQEPGLRANAEVVLLAADGVEERARFLLKRCLPVKVKAPPLNAKDGVIAIEELQLVYEALTLKQPEGLRG
jgi:phage tail-like protein